MSDDQRFVLETLNKCEFDDSNKIITDFKEIVKKQITDKNKLIAAFQFGSYIAKEVEKYGKEAMQTDLAFTEDVLLTENLELIKKLTRTTIINVLPFVETAKPKGLKQSPIPGSPVYYCE